MTGTTPPPGTAVPTPEGSYLEVRLHDLLSVEPPDNQRVRHLAAVLRLVVAAALAGAVWLVDEPRFSPRTFGLVVAFVWVPVAGALDALRRRFPGRPTDVLTLVADLGLVAGLALAVPAAGPVVMAGGVLLVVYYTYVRGLIFGLVGAFGIQIALVLPYLVDGRAELSAFDFALAPMMLVLAAVLLTAVRGERSSMSGVLARARERADAILTGVAEAVVVTSPRGRVRQWNAAAAGALDCSAAEAVGGGCHEVLGLRMGIETLDCSQGCALLRERLDQPDDDLQVWRARPDGRRQPLLAQVSPLLDDEGRLVEVVHSFRDITKLVQADEAKTLFLATASHELKTPLTVIMGYSELMLRRTDLAGDAREQGLKAMHERARQLTEIVDRILLSSRIDAGRVELEPLPIDVQAVLDESVANFAAAHGRRVTFDFVPGVPAALGDARALRTAIDHLVDNAIKYSGADDPVEISVSADDRWVVIEVSDHGIGMSRDELDHCFERFWQAETGDVRRFGGTGIGLYIVKSLVEAMCGEIEVASPSGAGSTFTVRVPRADRGAERLSEREPAVPEREPSIIREFMRQTGVG